jgi:acetate---CoA ligase (ADP-forming)
VRWRGWAVHRIEPLFKFASVAMVGASDRPGMGSTVYKALQTLGYEGTYYPINPRREEVHGLRAYPDPASLPTPIEAAVVAIPREGVLDAVRGCAERGARAVAVPGNGFAEFDEAGRALQTELEALVRERGLLLVGPNCFGAASLTHRCALFASSALGGVRAGNVAVISHSGGILNEVISYGAARGLGFSHVASTGNEAGVTAADLLDFFVDDPSTEVVLAVLETVRNPALFLEVADRAVAARKPLVILKLGSSVKGARSAFTHTAALSGGEAIYDAVFRQKGITRVHDLDDLIEMGVLFAGALPALRRRRLARAAAMDCSGGGKELTCDLAEANGVELPDPSEAAAAMIRPHLPEEVQVSNPLDSTGHWGSPFQSSLYPATLRAFAREPEIDVIISRYTIPRSGGLGALRERLDELAAARAEYPEPLYLVLARSSDQVSEEWARVVRDEGILFLHGMGKGMRALGRMVAYSRFLHARDGAAPARGAPVRVELPAGRTALNEVEAKDVLRAAGLPVVATTWARTADEAVAQAEALGYPVAAKVIAPQILHKSDVGGVRLGLGDAAAVHRAFGELEAVTAGVPGAEFAGVAVQPMAAPGLELVLGAHRDPQFGPVVLFGLGGVFVEVLRDVALRVAPLGERNAYAMLDEIRGRALLDGARGQPPANRAAIVAALLRLSDLMVSQPRIASVDLNPALSSPEGLLAVDARVVLDS